MFGCVEINCPELVFTLSVRRGGWLRLTCHDVPSSRHDCSAGGVVDKPKSALTPKTNYAVVVGRIKKKKKKEVKAKECLQGTLTGCGRAQKPTTGQSGDLFIHRAPLLSVTQAEDPA